MTTSLYPRVTATRRVQDLCGMWGFQFDPESQGQERGWTTGLPDPIGMPVPASFNDMFTGKHEREYAGDFWYETDLFVPGEWQNQEVSLRFEAATHRATVFLNGVQVGAHVGGFTPFEIPVTEQVRWNCTNHLAVLINNELSHTTLPAGETFRRFDGRMICKPYFDFFNYAGLQRPVKLVAMPKERIVGYSTDYTVSHGEEGAGISAEVRYDVQTTGVHDVIAILLDGDGSEVARAQGKDGMLTVSDAKLWNVGTPYLYTLRMTIVDDMLDIIDEYVDEIGIRQVCIDGTQFLVNGHPVYFKGFGRHEDSDIHGRGFDLAVMNRDFALMDWIGANSFRTSHYPYSEEQLKEADRRGYLVIDEVAAAGFMHNEKGFPEAAENKGVVHRGFFDDPAVQTVTLEAHRQAVRELVERDRNHPSVVMWSLMNEPDSTTDASVRYFEQIFAYARTLDRQHRPLTYTNLIMAAAGKDRCHHLADVVCLNRYYGWYEFGGFDLVQARHEFIKEMDRWMELEPNKPFLFTEYGADTAAGVHKLPSVMWSEEYQREVLEMEQSVFDSYDAVIGEQVWNFADFQTDEGLMRIDGNKKGIFTRARQPKAAAFLLKKRWAER